MSVASLFLPQNTSKILMTISYGLLGNSIRFCFLKYGPKTTDCFLITAVMVNDAYLPLMFYSFCPISCDVIKVQIDILLYLLVSFGIADSTKLGGGGLISKKLN